MNKNVIFEKIKERLISDFKIDAELLNPKAHLFDDLGLDSLDLVDLLANLKDYIGEKVNPGLLKNARILQDVVDLVYPIWRI